MDVADVGSVLQHHGCHRMPKLVAGAALSDIRRIDVLPLQVAQVIKAERLAGVREKHRRVDASLMNMPKNLS